MGKQQGTVDIKLALAVDLARMGLWPSDVRFTDASPEDQASAAWARGEAPDDDFPGLNKETPEEQYADPAYAAYQAELDRMCNASFVTGPTHDPYGTNCDLDAGHYPATAHEGDDPFGGDGRVHWRGGGSIEGDPLPQRDVHFVQAGAQR